MSEKINISIGGFDSTTARIKELVQNLRMLSGKITHVDLTDVDWITPLSILPLAHSLAKIQSKHSVHILMPENLKVRTYLETIHFPQGTGILSKTSYSKTYMPIFRIKMGKKAKASVGTVLDAAVDDYERILLDYLLPDYKYKRSLSHALKYFISEMTTNVHEHSRGNEFWIFAQYWGMKEELEICLLDDGVGLKGSYDQAGISTKDDLDALEKAMDGISAKKFKRESFGERGFGIWTSLKLITESPLNGEFIMMSGEAGYYKKHGDKPRRFRMPAYTWQGVLVSARVHRPDVNFNLHDYLE